MTAQRLRAPLRSRFVHIGKYLTVRQAVMLSLVGDARDEVVTATAPAVDMAVVSP
jgi:hypothetical protein